MEEAPSQIKILLSLQLAEGKYLRFYYFTSVSLAPKKVFQINTKTGLPLYRHKQASFKLMVG